MRIYEKLLNQICVPESVRVYDDIEIRESKDVVCVIRKGESPRILVGIREGDYKKLNDKITLYRIGRNKMILFKRGVFSSSKDWLVFDFTEGGELIEVDGVSADDTDIYIGDFTDEDIFAAILE